jgi:uncharacterized membrane protein YjjP (DUF1212 family)
MLRLVTPEEHCNLVLTYARVLYVNGQSTEETVAAAERLARTLGMRAEVALRWGQVQLGVEHRECLVHSHVAADPTGVHMQRVVAAMSEIEGVEAGRFAPDAARGARRSN